jgi:hypothetical protein
MSEDPFYEMASKLRIGIGQPVLGQASMEHHSRGMRCTIDLV